MKAVGSEKSVELIWCLVLRSVIYLPRRVSGKVSTDQPGHPASKDTSQGVLLQAGTTTSHARASWSLSCFPGEMWSPPSPSISCAACAGNQQMLTGAALGSQHVLVGLQFRAVVAQECCCGCSPLPGLPVRQGQWQPLPAGLAPKLLGCRASNVPVHRGSCARQTWQPNGISSTAPPQRWGFPAAVGRSSPRAPESCQLLQPPQQVSAERRTAWKQMPSRAGFAN